jgi:hypothetical protein
MVLVVMAAEVLLAAFLIGLSQKLVLVVLLMAGGVVLRQLHLWERQLLQGDGHPPRNRLA